MTRSSQCNSLSKAQSMACRMIYVTFQREGIHRYPDAPEDVAFLRHPHRHMFYFKVWIEVFHDDREIEFIRFKRELEGLYADGALQLDHRSCEMIADELHGVLNTRYPNRDIWIDVGEDGENGAFIRYDTPPRHAS